MAKKLTKVQARALAQWFRGPTTIYHADGVRADVGKRLLNLGLIAPESDRFPAIYSTCRITSAGRLALEKTSPALGGE